MSSSRRSRSRRVKQVAANIFVAFLGLVTLLLLVGLFLPRRYRVERSLELAVKPEAVYSHLANLRDWPEWTVWNRNMDPTVQFTFSGADTGVGAEYRWEGKQLGRGRLKLVEADPGKGVSYELDFEEGRYVSTGSIRFEPSGTGLKLTWVNEGELGRNPVNRYMGLMMDRMMGGDFEKGLAGLGTLSGGRGAAKP